MLRITITKNERKDCYNFWLDVDGVRKNFNFTILTDLSGLKEVKFYEVDGEDTTFVISNDEAQSLLEQLWNSGLRPKKR